MVSSLGPVGSGADTRPRRGYLGRRSQKNFNCRVDAFCCWRIGNHLCAFSAEKNSIGNETLTQDIPIRPDLRQSLCHTLLAAAFVIVGIVNPFAGGSIETELHGWMMVVLLIVVVLSWLVMVRRWRRWVGLPEQIKLVQNEGARLDRSRAKSHALMSALALMLTVFAFIGRAVIPHVSGSLTDELLFYTSVAVAVVSTVVLTRSIRDYFGDGRLFWGRS